MSVVYDVSHFLTNIRKREKEEEEKVTLEKIINWRNTAAWPKTVAWPFLCSYLSSLLTRELSS
jgi:hypothetical protein